MPAYVISELEVLDPVAIETYRTVAAKSIAQYGGRYLARGRRRALSWWNSPRWHVCANGTPRRNMPRR